MPTDTGATLRLAGALICALSAASCDTTAPAGAVWSLQPVSGDKQVVEVGTQVSPPVVRVLVKGRPLANIAVQWSADGNGSADGVTRTDAQGLARGMWWVGSIPGTQHLTASLGSALAEPVTFTATGVAGQMAHVFVRPETGMLQNVRDSLQLIATATDRLGNAVPVGPAAWSSLDPTTATVGSGGLVRGLNGGSARIVLASGTLADTATVIVNQPAMRLTIDPESAAIDALTQGTQLRAVAWDEFGNLIRSPSVTWSTIHPGIASVDARGWVTALANGSATIVARVGDASGTARVVVNQLATELVVNPLFPSLFPGDSVRIAVAAYDAARKPMPGATILYTSNDTSVATVSGSGWVRAVAVGSTIVYIAAIPGSAAGRSVVTVSARP